MSGYKTQGAIGHKSLLLIGMAEIDSAKPFPVVSIFTHCKPVRFKPRAECSF